MAHPSAPEWIRVLDPDDSGGSSNWLKWSEAEVGAELEGIWLGPRASSNAKYADFGAVKIAGGRVVNFGLPTLLRRRLDCVEPGRKIKVVYLGARETKSGDNHYHCFDVYSDRPALGPGAASRGALPEGQEKEAEADDDVPF